LTEEAGLDQDSRHASAVQYQVGRSHLLSVPAASEQTMQPMIRLSGVSAPRLL